jgi:hypothetical protein
LHAFFFKNGVTNLGFVTDCTYFDAVRYILNYYDEKIIPPWVFTPIPIIPGEWH